MDHRTDWGPDGHYVTEARSLDRVDRTDHLILRLRSWPMEIRGAAAGTFEAASTRGGYQLCCHQPMVRHREKVEGRPEMQQELQHSHLEPCLVVDEGRTYPREVEEVQVAFQVAYRAEAFLGGMNSQAEEDTGRIRSGADSTVVAERDSLAGSLASSCAPSRWTLLD